MPGSFTPILCVVSQVNQYRNKGRSPGKDAVSGYEARALFMKIISFARTTPALIARQKTVTRREWTDAHAARFKVGELVQAWSASPHRRGHRIGIIRITALNKEPTRQIPETDWEAEGFAYMAANGLELAKDVSCRELWEQWRTDATHVTWVIRFEVEEIDRL